MKATFVSKTILMTVIMTGLYSTAYVTRNDQVTLVPFSEGASAFNFELTNFNVEPTSNPVWPLEVMNVDRAHNLPNGQGEGVRICLIDTGVNLRHPALKDVIAEGTNFTPEGEPNNFEDMNGHGTWLATTIAGQPLAGMVGVAPKAKLVIAKILDKTGSGSFESVVKALEYCTKRADIINMSFGGVSNLSPQISELMAKMKLSGITLFAASGNITGDKLSFPSSDDSVLAIASVSKDLQIPSFSPVSSKLAFVSPGVNIPVLMEDLTIKSYSGSSFSAAYSSGVEAIRRSRHQSTVLKARTLGYPANQQGQGLIDAYLSSF